MDGLGAGADRLRDGEFLLSGRITDVEVTAALARRRGQPGLSVVQAIAALRQFRRDFGQDYRVVEITIALLQRAAQLAIRTRCGTTTPCNLAVALDVHARDQALVWSRRMPNSTRRHQPRGCGWKIRIRIREPTVPGIGWPIPLTVHSAC